MRSSPRSGNWYLHKFRHTFATDMLQSVDIRSLQIILGHKNISTTEAMRRATRRTHQNATASTLGLPCIPFGSGVHHEIRHSMN
jgi:integrase